MFLCDQMVKKSMHQKMTMRNGVNFQVTISLSNFKPQYEELMAILGDYESVEELIKCHKDHNGTLQFQECTFWNELLRRNLMLFLFHFAHLPQMNSKSLKNIRGRRNLLSLFKNLSRRKSCTFKGTRLLGSRELISSNSTSYQNCRKCKIIACR